MADKAISELVRASIITAADLFVLQQDNTAKCLPGQVLLNWLTAAADGHGGIANWKKIGTSGLVDTYRVTLADTTTFDYYVTNGKAISSVKQTSVSGLTRTYTIAFNDGATQQFTVTDGRSITKIEKTKTDVLTDTYTISYNDGTTSTFTVKNGKGISSFSKVSAVGLVDTYRITYNDGTSNEFTVTNGAKGDKGDNTYTHIKFASKEPTASSHSMGDIPDNWIGFYWGNSATAPTDWTMYKWYQFKGDKGDTGNPATLVSSKVEYQVSNSGTIIPSGTWQTYVPVVAQGQYMWTRTTQNFNTGNPVVSYSVSRMGLDGSGSVSSVANISPDSEGNVPLTAENVGALPNTGGDLTGELRMNGQPISGLNAPTANDQAANMGFVNRQVRVAAPRNLLDNSDFRNPVNQRGQTNCKGRAYTIDRWLLGNENGEVIVRSGYMAVTGGATDSAWFQQIVSNAGSLIGKTLTFAVKDTDDVLDIFTFEWSTDTNKAKHLEWGQLFAHPGTNDTMLVSLVVSPGFSKNFVWVALYEGVYTEETLPEYQPKGYGAELAECMRYYYRNWVGDMSQSTVAGVYVPYNSRSTSIALPIPMQSIPTITLYNPITRKSGCVADWSSDADIDADVVYVTEHHFTIAGNIQTGQMIAYNYEADAELL